MVFSFHYHAFMFIVTSVSIAISCLAHNLKMAYGILLLAFVASIFYPVLAARRAYGESLVRSAVKMMTAGILYVMAFAWAILASFMGAIYTS